MFPSSPRARPVVRCAFTLIELLVVIAIIGILVALLLPALQKVREASQRTQCTNNMKQYGIAFHMYHDQNGTLPYAAKNNPRTVWVALIWPYIEQDNLAKQYDYKRHFYEPPNTIFGWPPRFDTPYGQRLAIYYCPSDRVNAVLASPDDPYPRARGNYHLNWGDVRQPRASSDPVPTAWAPFGYLNFASRNQPRTTRFLEFTDGTSETMLMSEQLIPLDSDRDHRGDMLNDDEACTYFMTLMTPNTTAADVMAPGFCTSRPERQMPCTTAANRNKAARSRHPNGVNVMFGDGSVRFVSNGIALNTWKAIGTMNGGEVVPPY